MSDLVAVTNLSSRNVNAYLHLEVAFDCNKRVITFDYRNLVRGE